MEIYIAAFSCVVLTWLIYCLIEKKVEKGEKLLLYIGVAGLLFVISMSSPY